MRKMEFLKQSAHWHPRQNNCYRKDYPANNHTPLKEAYHWQEKRCCTSRHPYMVYLCLLLQSRIRHHKYLHCIWDNNRLWLTFAEGERENVVEGIQWGNSMLPKFDRGKAGRWRYFNVRKFPEQRCFSDSPGHNWESVKTIKNISLIIFREQERILEIT